MRITAIRRFAAWLALFAGTFPLAAWAATLPEDRSDVMYHYYKGGGVTVDGPAVLARKSIGDNLSFGARYYVDTVSSASIDVVTTASPYKDERTEYGTSLDYLWGNSLLSFAYTNSEESDYLAETYGINVSHELFGGMTTASLGYGQGRDVVTRVDNAFVDSIDRYQFRLGLSQIISRRFLFGMAYEGVSEDGYLSNPYRSVRIGLTFPGATQYEVYPRTRDSRALAIRGIWGWGSSVRPMTTALRLEYRYYYDTWDIHAHTLSLSGQRYFSDNVTVELRLRGYYQDSASFYNDLFPAQQFVYMSRDKELSTFYSASVGAKVNWQFMKRERLRSSVIFSWELMKFEYDNFTDIRTGGSYSFYAGIYQLLFSFWY